MYYAPSLLLPDQQLKDLMVSFQMSVLTRHTHVYAVQHCPVCIELLSIHVSSHVKVWLHANLLAVITIVVNPLGIFSVSSPLMIYKVCSYFVTITATPVLQIWIY